MNLLELQNQNQLAHFVSYVEAQNLWDYPYWLGLTRAGVSSSFVWDTDGSRLNYSRWYLHATSLSVTGAEGCVFIQNKEHNYTLDDCFCSNKFYGICYRDKPTTNDTNNHDLKKNATKLTPFMWFMISVNCLFLILISILIVVFYRFVWGNQKQRNGETYDIAPSVIMTSPCETEI